MFSLRNKIFRKILQAFVENAEKEEYFIREYECNTSLIYHSITELLMFSITYISYLCKYNKAFKHFISFSYEKLNVFFLFFRSIKL